MDQLPPPLVPPEVDLRDFPYMPLDVVRLRDSDIAGHPDAEVYRAATLAWCASWHQVPAGSLPDDDAILARLLGYGRDVVFFASLRSGALHNFVKCNDGRLYHPVVSEKAVEAWEHKLAQRRRTANASATRRKRPLRNDNRNGHRNDREKTDVTITKGREGNSVSSLRSESLSSLRSETDSSLRSSTTPPAVAGAVLLPGWVPPEAWEGWLEMRRRIRAPLTVRARSLALKTLTQLHDAGEDAGAILDQSTENSWRGLFPLHRSKANGSSLIDIKDLK